MLKQKQSSEGFFKNDVTRNFKEFTNVWAEISFLIKLNFVDLQLYQKREISSKFHQKISPKFMCLVNFAKFVRTPVLENTIGGLLLIIAISILVKGV